MSSPMPVSAPLGPRSDATTFDVVADLCGVLATMYGPEASQEHATDHDAKFLRSVLQSRLDEWMRRLPAACSVCHDPLPLTSTVCPSCEKGFSHVG